MAAPRVLSTARGSRPEAFGPLEWGLLASVALMWGSSFLWIAIGLEAFRPALIALSRIALGAVALGALRRSRAPVAREDWPRIVLLALVWTAIPLLLFPIAQDLGVASSTAGMINGAVPLFAAAFAAMLLRRAPRPLHAVGLVVGFAGVALVATPSADDGSGTALGTGLALLATVLYGLAANLIVPLQHRYGALPVIFRAQLVSLVGVLPFGIAAIPGSRWDWTSAVAMLVLGVFGTGLAYIASSTLLGRAGATRGSVQIYFVPIVALVLGVTFRDETVAPAALAGVALVLAGAWLASRRERVETPSGVAAAVAALLVALALIPVATRATAADPCLGAAPTILGTADADTLTGTEGDDVIAGGRGADAINGLGGNDLICGEDGRDTLNGGGGNDTVHGGAGPDTFRGGVGKDTVSYADRKGPAIMEIDRDTGDDGDPTLRGGRGEGDTIKRSVENAIGGSGTDSFVGTDAANVFRGRGGLDTFSGGLGADVAYGGGGQGFLRGEGGNDRLYGQAANDDTLLGGPGRDLLIGGGGLRDHADGENGTDTCDAEKEESCERDPSRA